MARESATTTLSRTVKGLQDHTLVTQRVNSDSAARGQNPLRDEEKHPSKQRLRSEVPREVHAIAKSRSN